MNDTRLDDVIRKLHDEYEFAHPQSSALNQTAQRVIPGGTTRDILGFRPFPFRVKAAKEQRLFDVDGHELVDFCGDFTSGLLGHTPDIVRDAVLEVLQKGWALGATHSLEIEAAELLCARFESLEMVRFTNSGTEANLLAIAAALHHTGRRDVLVFDHGFHGALLNFNYGTVGVGSALNVPHRFLVSAFNSVDGLERRFKEHDIGCAIIEPMQGAGGCRPADVDFLLTLRRLCDRYGAVLIFDEVQTSRLYPGGLQQMFGVVPDMTSLGKYFAGGLSFGAFGGRRALMEHFNTTGLGVLPHSGTFNNNVFSMAAAVAVLRNALNTDQLMKTSTRGESLRDELAAIFRVHDLPLSVSGIGSMMQVHADDRRVIEWLFHALLAEGIYISPRGLIALSFAISDNDCAQLISSIKRWSSLVSGFLRHEGSAPANVISG